MSLQQEKEVKSSKGLRMD